MAGLAHQGFSLEWEQILIWISLLPAVFGPAIFQWVLEGVCFVSPVQVASSCVCSAFVTLLCCWEVLSLLLPVDRKQALHSRAETVVFPKLLQFRGFVVINSFPQLAEKLYWKPELESLWGLWRSKEVGSSILLWCINKENFSYFCYHCSHSLFQDLVCCWCSHFLCTWTLTNLWYLPFLVVQGNMLVDMVSMYQNWCSCTLASVFTVFEAGVHTY